MYLLKRNYKRGLGIGDWGLGNPQSPIPNPQSPPKKIKKK